MDLTVNAAIAHKFVSERDSSKDKLVIKDMLANACLPPSETLSKVIDEIHEAYAQRSGKSHGIFEEDEINYPTSANLKKHYKNKEIDFVTTTHLLMKTLVSEANKGKAHLVTGAKVLIADISNDTDRWIVVTILTDKAGAVIDDKTLTLHESRHIDLSSLRFAGRVNITKWLNGEDRYVSFLKGGSDVSEYFQKFLGCTQAIALSKETNLLVSLVRDAVKNIDITDLERESVRKEIFDYLDACRKKGEPFSIDTLSNKAWPQEPELIRSVLSDPDTGISDGFIPARKGLFGLIRFEAKTPKWQVKFEREAVANGEVRLNVEKRELILTNVSDEDIERYLQDFKS